MTREIGRFRNEKAERRFLDGYDKTVRDWPVPLEPMDVTTAFGTTRLYRTGAADGMPVVLLPGMGGNSLGWIYTSGPLGRAHPVYLVDPIGAPGRSTQTRPLTGADDLTAWLAEVLDGIGVPVAYLVGYSYGGWQSMLAAIRIPERVAGMTLLDPAAFRTATLRHFAWAIACGLGLHAGPAIRRRLARLLHTDSINRPGDIMAAVSGAYLFETALPPMVPLTDEELAAITTPALVLLGAHSTMHDSPAVARRLARLVPSAEVDVVPGTGHSIALDLPDLVNTRILTHTTRVADGLGR
ncbi:alpha/beta hydrolase [Nonomuraea sp. K274]|uniref:Alpha/beta hydrolase n=1 Tax=Nonomuraea cypriaca TaxID=1187855 RepID=A0A931EZS4_9ACTN|nr:alpha/beta hydrolase [Nonomuraea cypriaca]MBF8188645.1 alpha/beta hydrolase [Nonomuraea cypriaca]